MHGTIYVICNIYVLSYTGKMQHIKNVVENRGKRGGGKNIRGNGHVGGCL